MSECRALMRVATRRPTAARGAIALRRRMFERAADEAMLRPRVWLEALEPRWMMSAAAADFDTSFGVAGSVAFTVPAPAHGDAAADPKIALAPGGKILVYGSYAQTAGSGDYFASNDFWVARFNADGSADASFGEGGVTRVDAPTSFVIDSFVPEADGRVLVLTDHSTVAGWDPTNSGDILGGLTFMRLDADGSIDPTFGNGGSFIIPGPSGPDADALIGGAAMWEGSDGGIVALYEQGGHLVMVHLTADGLPDESFGSGGTRAVATLAAGGAWNRSFAVQPLAGGGVMAYLLTSAEAVPHVSPPSDQLMQTRVDDQGDVVAATTFTRQRDQSVVVYLLPEADGGALLWDSGLARVRRDGTLDEAFGGGEPLFTPDLPVIVPQADGTILLLRTDVSGPSADWTSGIQRFTAEGVADPTFAAGGVAGRFPANDLADARTLADGSVLAAVYTDDNYLRFSLVKLRPEGGIVTPVEDVPSGDGSDDATGGVRATGNPPAVIERLDALGDGVASGWRGLFDSASDATVWNPDGTQDVYA